MYNPCYIQGYIPARSDVLWLFKRIILIASPTPLLPQTGEYLSPSSPHPTSNWRECLSPTSPHPYLKLERVLIPHLTPPLPYLKLERVFIPPPPPPLPETGESAYPPSSPHHYLKLESAYPPTPPLPQTGERAYPPTPTSNWRVLIPPPPHPIPTSN